MVAISSAKRSNWFMATQYTLLSIFTSSSPKICMPLLQFHPRITCYWNRQCRSVKKIPYNSHRLFSALGNLTFWNSFFTGTNAVLYPSPQSPGYLQRTTSSLWLTFSIMCHSLSFALHFIQQKNLLNYKGLREGRRLWRGIGILSLSPLNTDKLLLFVPPDNRINKTKIPAQQNCHFNRKCFFWGVSSSLI